MNLIISELRYDYKKISYEINVLLINTCVLLDLYALIRKIDIDLLKYFLHLLLRQYCQYYTLFAYNFKKKKNIYIFDEKALNLTI